MKTLEHKDRWGRVLIYEVVEKVPKGYKIWNIGDNMEPGYLPLYEELENWHANPDTLKAVKIEGAEKVLAAIGNGTDTLKKMKTYIKKYASSKKAHTLRRVERIKAAIEVLEKVKLKKK